MNVGEIWKSLADKVRRSEYTIMNKAPLKDAPPIPAHKTRPRGGYSIVVIGQSGKSRQYELSAASSKVAMGFAILLLFFLTVGLVSSTEYLLYGSSKTASDSSISEKLNALQEELRNKEVALAVHESRLKEQQLSGESAQASRDLEQASGSSDLAVHGAAGKGSMSSSVASLSPNQKLNNFNDSSVSEPEKKAQSNKSNTSEKSDTNLKATQNSAEKSDTSFLQQDGAPIVNFNTQDVAVATESQGSGTLSFRLVKDHPNLLFSGYLFVFVEMEDKRGENKIYVYPDKTRLGEGDLPSDFREGESISFKYNSRVELPFGDIRSGASLARVSILLYGENGRIVFQRGFDKQELNIAIANSKKTDSTRQKTASEKRRPL
ncbi:MAG: hypothetical protein AB7V04_11490 [Desulfomonilaceae bacterium]